MFVEGKKDMRCPSCGATMGMVKDIPGTVFFGCPKCGGRSAGLMLLRRLGMPLEVYDMLREAAKAPAKAFAKLCPHCGQKMRACAVNAEWAELELDVCGICDQVWFDPYEFHKMPIDFEEAMKRKPDSAPKTDPASFERAFAKTAAVGGGGSSSGSIFADDSEDGPPEGWQWLPALLGMPVEVDREPLRRLPWVTWSMSLVMAIVFLVYLTDARHMIEEWGFICSQWSRHYGLTIFTSFLLHGGFLHIIGNLYFFLIFGDNSEERLGWPLFFLLLWGSHLFGTAAYWFFNPHGAIPSIGASGGIAGVLAFYAVSFPGARLGFFLRFGYVWQWVRLPAIFAFVLYLGLQILGAYMQLSGFGNVNYLCHLGGMFVGFAAAIAMRLIPAGTAEPAKE